MHAAGDDEVVAKGGKAAEIGVVRAGDDRVPVVRRNLAMGHRDGIGPQLGLAIRIGAGSSVGLDARITDQLLVARALAGPARIFHRGSVIGDRQIVVSGKQDKGPGGGPPAYTAVFADALTVEATRDEKTVAITAAMPARI